MKNPGISNRTVLLFLVFMILMILPNPASAVERGFRTESHFQTMTGTSHYFALNQSVGSTDKAFVLVKYYEGQRTSACGTAPGTNDLEPNYGEFSCYLYNTSHVHCQRNASTNDIYISYQILEAIDGEFNVYRGSLPFSGTSQSFNSSIGVSVNASNSMAWINGMQTSSISRDHRSISFTADVEGVGMQNQVTIRRNNDTAVTGVIRWIVVEWNKTMMPDFNLTKGLIDVDEVNFAAPRTVAWSGNKSNSILFHQFRTSGDDGLNQHAVAGNIDSDSQLSFWRYDFNAIAAESDDQYYVLDFSGDYAGGVLSRQENIVGVATQCVWDVALPSSVDTTRSLISISNSMDGDGTAYPRPFFWFYFSSGSTIEVEKRYDGNNQRMLWQVLELPYSPYVISWNQSDLGMGPGLITSGNLTANVNISVEANQSNITVDCQQGNCSFIIDDWIDDINLTDGQSRQINFTCLNNTIGIFWAAFSVYSLQEPMEDVINITCEFTGSTYITWNQTTLDLGVGNVSFGNITGLVDIVSTGANNQVNVSCDSGNCSTISQNWTNGTNMADSETIQVEFECDDTYKGIHSAVFSVISIEDTIQNSISVNCTMNDITPPGTITNLKNQSSGYVWLYWNWTNPIESDFNHVEVWLNNTFHSNVSVNYINISGLWPDTNYEIQIRTVDDDGNINQTWKINSTKTLYNYQPNIYLNNPLNGSTDSALWRILNATPADTEDQVQCVEIFGRVGSEPLAEDLLYKNCSAINNSDVFFNFSEPLLEADATTEVLWHFDNRSVFNESDAYVYNFAGSAQNHDRTCVSNCPTYDAAGKFGGCFEYNGANELFTMDESFFNNAFSEKSFQAWIKPNALVGVRTIYEEGGGTNGFGIRLNGNMLEFIVRNNGGGVNQTNLSTPYTDTGNWHFVTAQFNNSNLTLYLDGVLVNTTNSWYATIAAHSDEAGLGASNGGDAMGGGGFFNGRIDEVRILTTILTGQEVLDNFRLSNNSKYFWSANVSDQFFMSKSDTWEFTMSAGNISWNISTFNMGVAEPIFGNLTKNTTIIGVASQTNISVVCDKGNCSYIKSGWVNGTNMSDKDVRIINFTCLNSTTGVFSALYNVTSNEDQVPDQINVSCEMLPNVNVIWNQTVLDLGSGDEKAGNLTGYANITSNEINNNVTAACSTGNCSKITHNWTNGTDMVNGESKSVKFECNDSEPGSFSAVFGIKSNEDTTLNTLTVTCLMLNPPPGIIKNLDNWSSGYSWIQWNWTNPTDYDFSHVEIWVNGTFFSNTSVNYSNVTGLNPDTEYEIQIRTVDDEGNINTTWVNDTAKTYYNFPVNITLISPKNASFDWKNWRLLNATVTDVESSILCVEFFGDEGGNPAYENLLYKNCSVINDTLFYYNWTSQVLETNADVEVLWHFDNRSKYLENNTFVFDFSGAVEDHDMNCSLNCPDFVPVCKFAGCFNYNGASDYWILDESYWASAITERSFQAWIKPDVIGGTQIIYEEGGGTNAMGIRLNGQEIEFLTRNGTSYDSITTPYTDTSAWHFITAQFNNSNLTLYLDGILVNTTSVGYGTIEAHNVGGLGYTYQSNPFPVAGYFDGKIDEVRFLTKALSPAEVLANYNLTYGSTYFWQVEANDEYEEQLSDIWQFTILDIIPPSWDPEPPNLTINYSDSIYYDANATDNYRLGYFAINDTNNFKINSTTGVIENNTNLSMGIYRLNISVNDSDDNINWTIITITVNDTIFPDVRNVTPIPGTDYYIGDSVNITANITDNHYVKKVFANISWKGGSAWQEMLDSDGNSIYDTLFLNTFTLGRYNLTILANDTLDNQNNTENTWFNVNANYSLNFTINSPINRSGDSDGDITFYFNLTSNYEIANCSLFMNGTLEDVIYNVNKTKEVNFTIYGKEVGKYIWQINCTDIYGGQNNSQINQLTILRAVEFNGITINFSQVDMENIVNLIFEVTNYGLVNFSESVDLSGGFDIDQNMEISENMVTIDTVQIPELNKSATLEFQNFDYLYPPIMLKDDVLCNSSICNYISYDNTTGTFVMNVTHFTSYSTTANSYLIIYDDEDEGGNPAMYDYVSFYANYSNLTSSEPIVGGGVWCRISFSDSAENFDMVYDAPNEVYVYNRTFDDDEAFDYNVTCNGNSNGYEEAETSDIIVIARDSGYIKDGNCTLEYIEIGEDFKLGYIQRNEEVRIFCESPLDIIGGEDITIVLIPENGIETRKQIKVPEVISDKYEILYP